MIYCLLIYKYKMRVNLWLICWVKQHYFILDMFNVIEIRSYFTKIIWFEWDTYDHIRLEIVVRYQFT
jgi:hypothetical protein